MAELKQMTGKRAQPRNEKSRLAAGDGGGYVVDMNARIAKLEGFALDTRDRLSRIEERLEACATKSDVKDLESTMHKELHGLTWKLIGIAGVLVSMVYFVATQVKT
ncbi:hypothetical protein SAMN04515620_101251 [Collimonas sp. OK607]|uniref:hypothetical protein n=1 Tax=Collimonas sp. OK607 TaxID=1798194 RepID=UPI0008E9FF2A|nr:hypothetical protein [Collimonas sp. OK607]SFA71044.1 hypothetical protein SAMN04515620_101251 [Collimonas sp. OK607]